MAVAAAVAVVHTARPQVALPPMATVAVVVAAELLLARAGRCTAVSAVLGGLARRWRHPQGGALVVEE